MQEQILNDMINTTVSIQQSFINKDFLYFFAFLICVNIFLKASIENDKLKKWKENIDNGTNKSRFYYVKNSLEDERFRWAFCKAFLQSAMIGSIMGIMGLIFFYLRG